MNVGIVVLQKLDYGRYLNRLLMKTHKSMVVYLFQNLMKMNMFFSMLKLDYDRCLNLLLMKIRKSMVA